LAILSIFGIFNHSSGYFRPFLGHFFRFAPLMSGAILESAHKRALMSGFLMSALKENARAQGFTTHLV
jgi:hypothetical protein